MYQYPECGVCDRQFNSWSAARQHADAVGHIYECESCTDAYYEWEGCRDHMDDEDHWEKAHKCEGCRQSFHSRAEAKRHMYQQDHWETYRCKPCDKGFESESNLRQHLNSSIHRGTDITCPFCRRGFATATGVTHHLETGSCPNAAGLNRDTILAEIRRRDPNHKITKKLLTYHTDSSITATSASWNPDRGLYECYLCHRGFRDLKSLNNHANSPAHKEHVYHCPGRVCGREFRTLAALFNHLESETCGAMKFATVQNNVGGILNGGRMIGFK